MNVRIKSSLLDIYQSIDEIFIFLGDRRDFSEYQSDLGTRNRIIHSYDNISDEVLWTIFFRDLPQLKVQVEQLLSE